MALTASSGCSKMENEHEIVQSDTDSRGSQSNDSGNELSVGGSSSEGGDSMSNHQNHNDNDDLVGNDQNHLHHHHHHGSFDGLKGFVTPSGNDNTTDRQIDFSSMPQPPPSAPPMLSSISPSKSMFKALVGPMVPPLASSLFDTPASLLQSPQNLDVFSPSFGFSNQRQQQIFQCALCGNLAQLGLLQFMCAHKICQTCCQTTPSSNETKKVCGICGAGPAVITNFPPQMFLSPTNSVSPHGGNQFDGASNRGLSTQRNFSFSLNGIPVSPNLTSAAENCFSKMPIQPENEHLNPYTLKNIDSLSSSSMWTSLAPPPLALKNISNLNPKFENKDDIPVFSPLSPTNTSILPPQPLTSSPKEINSPKMPWAIAPPRPSLSSTSTATTVFQTTPHNQISVTPVTPPLLGSDINGSNNPFGSSMCQGCDGKPSSAFCLQCQETLCTHCIQAHQRVRATKSHRIVGLRDIFAHLIQQQQQQQSQFSSPMQDDILCGNRTNTGSIGSLGDGHPSFGESESLSGDSSPRSSSVCGFHESKIVAICENCSHPLCAFCVSHHSNQHNIYPVGDIRQAINEMSNESCRLGWHCEETVDAISKIIDSVKSNAITAENEIRTTIDSHIKALEERKTDLLNRLETAKNLKLSILSNQSEKLRSKRRDLTEAVIKAKAALETLPKEDEADMKSIFRQLSVLMRCVETMETSENRFQMLNVLMLSCQVNEDDKLKFLPPQDGTLLNKIRQFGNVESGPCAKTSTIMGDAYKKGIRDRQSVIYVQLRDACDDILPSSVAATQTNCLPLLPHQTKYEKTIPASDVQAVLIGPDGSPIETNITPRENGIVAISYLPYVEGNYQLTVLVKGTPINGCPAKIDIRRGRNYEDIASNGPILTFGKEGSGDGELCRPWGICVDLRGRVLVADRSNNRIQIFDKDGNFLSKFGTSGNRPGQFDRPAGITTNTKNHIIVADKDNHRIQVFDENGNFMLKFGDRGRAIGYFNYPWGVATNSHNAIAVSDTRNHRVQIFTEQGQFVRKCGFDSAYFFKNLDSPRGLCYLPDGQLLITDFNNHRLAVLSPRNMSEMKVYGCEGDVDGMFVRPQGVKIDSEGHILVCDSRNNRIQVFDSNDMRFIASFGLNPQTAQGFQMPTELAIPYSSLSGPFGAPAFSSTPTPLNQSPRQLLDRPTDIAVGPDGRIYVVDFGNNCIRVF